MKNIDQTKNYFIQEVQQNELMSIKHKTFLVTLSYIEHFLILDPTITGCISTYAFASLLGIPVGSTSSAIGLKDFAIGAKSKKH